MKQPFLTGLTGFLQDSQPMQDCSQGTASPCLPNADTAALLQKQPRHQPFNTGSTERLRRHGIRRSFFLSLLLLVSQATVFALANKAEAVSTLPVIRINCMAQNYDYRLPWQKRDPYPSRGTGVIIEGGRILVTASLIANATYIEIERPVTGEKHPATVTTVDYEANLALLTTESDFLADLGTFPIQEKSATGDSMQVLQIENNGVIAATPATLMTIALAPYPTDTLALLTYKLSLPMQNRDGSAVLPVARNGRLCALLMNYESRTQSGDAIPGSVIAQFLARAALHKPQTAEESASPVPAAYAPFPRLGITIATTTDPQFRKAINLEGHTGGIYITQVAPDSSGAVAGLRCGDVLLSLGGYPIDSEALYDDPDYGKIRFSHIVTSRPPDAPPLACEILRNGEILNIELVPLPPDWDKAASRPYLFDSPPPYFILGGLVFQELSRPYLRSFGPDWRKEAPQRLVYLDATKDDLPADRGKIIILSTVLPCSDTIDYDNYAYTVVTRINGIEIKSIADVARAAAAPITSNKSSTSNSAEQPTTPAASQLPCAAPKKGFHKIEFDEDPCFIYLDAESVEKNRPALDSQYGIPNAEAGSVDTANESE